MFEVPEQTALRDRVKGQVNPETTQSGPSPIFSKEEECHLVDNIKDMASLGYGYTRQDVINNTFALVNLYTSPSLPVTLQPQTMQTLITWHGSTTS